MILSQPIKTKQDYKYYTHIAQIFQFSNELIKVKDRKKTYNKYAIHESGLVRRLVTKNTYRYI